MPDDDAVDLFIERAAAVEHGFRATEPVGEICRRLDGLPLAIELAAARVALLSPDELLTRLDKRLPLLASRSRDAPARQQTLRATIEWSYELLEPPSRSFQPPGGLRGGFALEAAESICGADLGVLESLVVKSLVRRLATGRLLLLDTIREYAVELLDASAEAETIPRRHAEFFLDVGERANLDAAKLRPGGQRVDLAVVDVDNFRAALEWAIRSGSIELGLTIATSVEQLWAVVDPSEGVRWFERLFDHPQDGVPDSLRAQALRAFGSALHISGRPDLAEQGWIESLAIFDRLGDEHHRAVMLHRLGLSAMLLRGDLDGAEKLVKESDEIHRRRENIWGQAQTTGALGAIARDRGDERAALDLVRQSASLAREVDVIWWTSGALAELACLSLNAGLVDEGDEHARAALAIADSLRDHVSRIFGVGILASIAAERGDAERAGRLWAVVEDEQVAAPLGGWLRHRAEAEERMRKVAGPDFDRGYAEGRELDLDGAVSLALGGE